MNIRTPCYVLTLIAGALPASPALAARAADEAPMAIVRYDDLDLSKRAGAETLYRRIKGAARVVCGPLESRELVRRRLWSDCYEQAVESAVAAVNRATLTALHHDASSRRG